MSFVTFTYERVLFPFLAGDASLRSPFSIDRARDTVLVTQHLAEYQSNHRRVVRDSMPE